MPHELPVFALTKRSLANIAISHCEPYSQERFLANTAWYPLVLSNFFFVVALPIERTEINFSHVPLSHVCGDGQLDISIRLVGRYGLPHGGNLSAAIGAPLVPLMRARTNAQ